MNNFYAQYKFIEPYLKKKDLSEKDVGKEALHQTPEQRKLLVSVVCGSVRSGATKYMAPFTTCRLLLCEVPSGRSTMW